MDRKTCIQEGKAYLGIEFGSTRIKGVLIDKDGEVLAIGTHDWENRLENGVWTYSMEDITEGLHDTYRSLAAAVQKEYGVPLKKLGAIGISAMMHGYLAFNEKDELLVPFRTWRNNITGPAAAELTELFDFNIPERWTIAHLYQAILNGEPHVDSIRFVTTLAGFVHWKLTGEKVLGVGDASGVFPIDSVTKQYDAGMMEKFEQKIADRKFSWTAKEVLPKVLCAGDVAGVLTAAGAAFLDPTGTLEAGVPFCPPEGDAGTGMTATNSVGVRTGNVSAGTSAFAMVVLEKPLAKLYREIDMVTTPDGLPCAMAHANNCTSDINAWVSLFKEVLETFGAKVGTGDLYTKLFKKSLEGRADGAGLIPYGYYSGEFLTGFSEGRPLFARTTDCEFNLANFMRSVVYSSMGALKVGMDILAEEGVAVDRMVGHGGLFKTEGVAEQYLADAIHAPVTVLDTAGEGGAWGIAVLAAFMAVREEKETLPEFLNAKIFPGMQGHTAEPKAEQSEGFEKFMELYRAALPVERAAVESMK